jgi:glycosyltransferase involved in cell wall biosynthesis
VSGAPPTVSVILIAYRMSSQLLNTLSTLAPEYQRNCTAGDYEVIVVENSSDDNLDGAAIESLPGNFRYYLYQEASQSPVNAINFAFQQCRGHYIGLIMDGARMLSPGVVHSALLASRLSENAVAVIPGYHLGEQEQHLNQDADLALQRERELLASVDWRRDGYELFSISTFSGANRRGYLHPIMECNCLFASRDNYAAIGHADPRFTQPGGGSINLHIYRSLGMLPGSQILVFPGEGSFHQFHGGVTTSAYTDRDAELGRHLRQLNSFWPGGFHAVRRAPTLVGEIPHQALPFMLDSVRRSRNRLDKMRADGKDPWPDDTALNMKKPDMEKTVEATQQ